MNCIKKVCFYCVVILFMAFTISAETTELEKMWALSEQYNSDLLTAQNTINEYALEYKYRWAYFKPSVSLSSSLAFSDFQKEIKKKPTTYTNALSFSIPLPGALSVGSELTYTLSRNSLDPTKPMSLENMAYNHIASFSLSLTQSLLPYWLQGNSKDPLFMQLAISKTIAQEKYTLLQNNIKQAITTQYLGIRMILESIETYTKLIEFTEKQINNAESLLENGQIQREDLWTLQETKQSYTKDKIALLQECNEQKKQFYKLIGKQEDELFKIDYTSQLPQQSVTSQSHNIEKQIASLENEVLRQNYIQVVQNNAPLLSLNAGLSLNPELLEKNVSIDKVWNSDKNWDWNLSVLLDVSSLLNKENKKEKLKLQIQTNETQRKIETIEKDTEIQKSYYSEYLETLFESLQLSHFILENIQTKYSDYVALYEMGNCSLMDLETVSTQLFVQEKKVENLQNEQWLYQWLLNFL